jgi:hypothetical protein
VSAARPSQGRKEKDVVIMGSSLRESVRKEMMNTMTRAKEASTTASIKSATRFVVTKKEMTAIKLAATRKRAKRGWSRKGGEFLALMLHMF